VRKCRKIVQSNKRHARWIVGAGIVAAGIVLPGPIASAASAPFMSGGGLQFGPHTTSQFAVSAHGVGPDATGSLNAQVPTGSFHATVTCLQVIGNDATATVVISSSHDPTNPVGEILVGEGVDNGHPSTGTSPDLWRLSFENSDGIAPTGQTGCWVPFYSPVPIQQGNIVVSDEG
jgi:hypothetical protein